MLLNLIDEKKIGTSKDSDCLFRNNSCFVIGNDKLLKCFSVLEWDFTILENFDEELKFLVSGQENLSNDFFAYGSNQMFKINTDLKSYKSIINLENQVKGSIIKSFICLLDCNGEISLIDLENFIIHKIAPFENKWIIDFSVLEEQDNQIVCLMSDNSVTKYEFEKIGKTFDHKISQIIKGTENHFTQKPDVYFEQRICTSKSSIYYLDAIQELNIFHVDSSLHSFCHIEINEKGQKSLMMLNENFIIISSMIQFVLFNIITEKEECAINISSSVKKIKYYNNDIVIFLDNGIINKFNLETKENNEINNELIENTNTDLICELKTNKENTKSKRKKILLEYDNNKDNDKKTQPIQPLSNVEVKEDSLNLNGSYYEAFKDLESEQLMFKNENQDSIVSIKENHLIKSKDLKELVTIESQNPLKQEISKNQKESSNRIMELIGKYPQGILYSGSTSIQNGRKLLKANHVGEIRTYNDSNINTIEIKFADISLHKKLIIDNKDNYFAGDINERGFALISKGKVVNLDEYEDEEDCDEETPKLYFKSVHPDFDWTIEFPIGVNLESVTVSSQFVVLSDSNSLIRVYDHAGTQMLSFTFDSSLTTIISFEYFIGVVYSTSLPLFGHQSLKIREYNLKNNKIELDLNIAISPSSKLQWIGYSDDGVFYTQDSLGIIRTLKDKIFWTPILENSNTNFWITGVIDKELTGFKLLNNEKTPSPLYQYSTIAIKRNFSIYNSYDLEKSKLLEIAVSEIDLTNNKELLQNFYHIKESYTSDVYRNIFKDKIKSQEDLSQGFTLLETQKIEYIRFLCVNGNYNAAMFYALQIKSKVHFDIVLSMFEKLKLKKIAESLKSMANEFGHFALLSGVGKTDLSFSETITNNETKTNNESQNSYKLKNYIELQENSKDNSENYFQSLKQQIYSQDKVSEEPENISQNNKVSLNNIVKSDKTIFKKDLLSDLSSLTKNTDNERQNKKFIK